MFGPSARGTLYIQLSNFPKHYLVIIITADEFRYALISVTVLTETTYNDLMMNDIAWLDVRRIHGAGTGEVVVAPQMNPGVGVYTGAVDPETYAIPY